MAVLSSQIRPADNTTMTSPRLRLPGFKNMTRFRLGGKTTPECKLDTRRSPRRTTATGPTVCPASRSRRHQWACDEFIHARAHWVRSLATTAPIFSLENDNLAMSNTTRLPLGPRRLDQ